MTNTEAIELIRCAQAEVEWDYTLEYAAAFNMAIEALELLKAQEARVLTLEEACIQDVCWLEWRRHRRKPVACRVIMKKDYAGQPLPYVYRFFEEPTGYGKKNYGKDWRCWTAKPTDEQRKKVKWDD